eukprot:803540-Prymnesium_polylepis.2
MLSRTPSRQQVSCSTSDVAPLQLTSMAMVGYLVCSSTVAGSSSRLSSSALARISSRKLQPSAVCAWMYSPHAVPGSGGPRASTTSWLTRDAHREPQSAQSAPRLQHVSSWQSKSLPKPPSSHSPSRAYAHVSLQHTSASVPIGMRLRGAAPITHRATGWRVATPTPCPWPCWVRGVTSVLKRVV